MVVNALSPFLTVPWVGLQCVIVAFPGHTHLLFLKITGGGAKFILLHDVESWSDITPCDKINKPS